MWEHKHLLEILCDVNALPIQLNVFLYISIKTDCMSLFEQLNYRFLFRSFAPVAQSCFLAVVSAANQTVLYVAFS